MGQLNRWLVGQGREVDELTLEVAEEFLAIRRARGQRRVPTLASLVPLFEYLKKRGVVRPEQPKPPTAREELLAGYHRPTHCWSVELVKSALRSLDRATVLAPCAA
jgi:hypothetical protein